MSSYWDFFFGDGLFVTIFLLAVAVFVLAAIHLRINKGTY
jgi:hypothetical protein